VKNQRNILRKTLVILIVFLFISMSAPPSNALAQKGTNNKDKNLSLIMLLLKINFDFRFLNIFSVGRYFYRQMRPPVAIQAYPDAVDLKYLNETTFNIGGKNPDTLEWESMIKVVGGWNWAWWSPRIIYSFEFIPPKDAPGDVWNVQFDPEQLIMDTNTKNLNWSGAEDPFRTNVTIMLKPSLDPTYPSEDVVLKVNIVREELLDHNLIRSGAPKWVFTHHKEYIEKMDKMDPTRFKFWDSASSIIMYRLLGRRLFFLMNLLQFPSYDKWVDSTVQILIRVNKYHQAEIIPPLPLDIKPYEVKSIPVTIRNLGSHIDTFNFRVKTTDKNMVVTPPPAITLKPGEEAQALVGVAAPKSFLSLGATTSIFLEAYSIYDPNNVFSNTITLSIVGVHLAGSPTYNFVIFLITLFVIFVIIFYFIRKRREKICIKPDKPWDNLEEKKYLEKLKEKDRRKYKDTLRLMKDEYDSSMLWYKYYCNALIKTKKGTRKKIEIKIGLMKLSEKVRKKLKEIKETRKEKLRARKEEINVQKEKLPEEKPVEKPISIIETKPLKIKKIKIIDKKAELERTRRDRIISRIKREQERQIRKIGSGT